MDSRSLRKAGVMGVTAALAIGAAGQAGAAEPTPANHDLHATTELAQGVQRVTPSAVQDPMHITPSAVQEPMRATPSMLGTKLSPSAKGSLVSVRGQLIKVSADQLEAYNALSPEVRAKLGPAVNGQVLNPAELAKISSRMSTVMCAW